MTKVAKLNKNVTNENISDYLIEKPTFNFEIYHYR